MLKTTKHIQAIQQEVHHTLNLPFTPDVNTTLNSKYSFAGDGSGLYHLNLVGLTLHGSPFTLDPDFIQRRQSPTDCDVPMPIPFLVKPTNIPLTPRELTTYRCIVKKTINSKDYNLCYLKHIVPKDVILRNLTADTHTMTSLEYKHPSDALTPPYKQNVNLTDKTYIACSGSFSFTITDEELVTIKDAINLLYPGHDALIGGFGFYKSQVGITDNSNILLDTSVRYKQNLTKAETLSFDIGASLPIHTT